MDDMAANDPIVTNAFTDLLRAINPFLDASHENPSFHNFFSLPSELRCLVYEAYFRFQSNQHGETRSFAMKRSCAWWIIPSWADMHFDTHWEPKELPGRKSSMPFFPAICLVNKRIGSEAAVCMLSTAKITMHSFTARRIFTRIVSKFSLNDKLLDSVHYVKLLHIDKSAPHHIPRSMNHPLNEFSLDGYGDAPRPERHQYELQEYMSLTIQYSQLRVLTLEFECARSLIIWLEGTRGYEHGALSVSLTVFQEVFDLSPIWTCANLQKLTLKTYYYEEPPMDTLCRAAQWLKNGFTERGMDVEICAVRFDWRVPRRPDEETVLARH